ncbi:MAG: 4'-phosphopantetheinyl transferase superfamily protein [bacterium]
MIKGIGIDLVEIRRFSEISDNFLKQVFNTQEISATKHNPIISSIKFSLKEAILKALGKGLHFGFFWHNIVLKDDKTTIFGVLRQNLSEPYSIHTSTSNSKNYACAIAIIEDHID